MINALSGTLLFDDGEIINDRKKVGYRSPLEARNAGIRIDAPA